jgi:hypothetical protein
VDVSLNSLLNEKLGVLIRIRIFLNVILVELDLHRIVFKLDCVLVTLAVLVQMEHKCDFVFSISEHHRPRIY